MRSLAKILSALAFFSGVAVIQADTAPATHPPTTLSVADMTSRAAAIQSQIQNDYRHVLSSKERAAKQKDVIKLTCVNDKLVQVKAQMNIADSTNDQLQAALAKNSDDRSGLFTSLVGTGEAIKLLREQASACIGEPELYKQEAGVEVTRPDIPDDPTATTPVISEFEPPAYASPFR